MGFVPELDEKRKAATREKILKTALHMFSEKTIDAVNLKEISKEAGIGMATVYRHFDKKPDLVLAVSAWSWEQYRLGNALKVDKAGMTAAEYFEFYLESFIDLYRNHRDILRFNQYFNAYVKREGIPHDRMKPYEDVINSLEERFHQNYLLGEKDGTLRTDISEKRMFATTLHLMLAAVTRYAVGLVYDVGIDPEEELDVLKKMLMREYTSDLIVTPSYTGGVS